MRKLSIYHQPITPCSIPSRELRDIQTLLTTAPFLGWRSEGFLRCGVLWVRAAPHLEALLVLLPKASAHPLPPQTHLHFICKLIS